MQLADFRLLIAARRDGAQKKGELKIKAHPTMLLKIKEQRSDNLTNATMLMKTNSLNFRCHDIDENRGG
jgi:hypothetical protein